MLNVIMLTVIMLNVIMLNVIMLNVIMLNVIMLTVVMVCVVSPDSNPQTCVYWSIVRPTFLPPIVKVRPVFTTVSKTAAGTALPVFFLTLLALAGLATSDPSSKAESRIDILFILARF
jgi:hypothetical protein